MSVQANTFYEHYLKLLTHRLVLPNMLMIWSMAHPLFPQVTNSLELQLTLLNYSLLNNNIKNMLIIIAGPSLLDFTQDNR